MTAKQALNYTLKRKALRRENHPFARTPVVNVGRAVCQETEGGFLIMLPTGQIEFRSSATDAERLCRKFFKRKCPPNEISFGTIIWHYSAKVKKVEVLQPTGKGGAK